MNRPLSVGWSFSVVILRTRGTETANSQTMTWSSGGSFGKSVNWMSSDMVTAEACLLWYVFERRAVDYRNLGSGIEFDGG